jgi:hypothetical protein
MAKRGTRNTNSGDIEIQDLAEMMQNMSAQLAAMNVKLVKLDTIDTIDSEVKGLKVLICDLKNENKQLKSDNRDMQKQLSDMNSTNVALENRVIHLEQYHRSWSARALNIPLTPEEESDNSIVAAKVYSLLLLPILHGAADRKLIPHIPTVDQLLEVAHILPGKAGEPKPVIMRFYSRNVKEIIFKLKKFYAPRVEGTASGASREGRGSGDREGDEGDEAGGFEGRGKYCFPLYEDLVRAAFQKLRALSKDDRVKAAWSVKGQIRFILYKSPKEIRKVVSLLDPIETILQ